MERSKGGAAGAVDPTISAEADKAYKKGEAALKTGVFKWSPDYTAASMYFEKAAKQFKQAGNKARAGDAFLRWSACCEHENENYGTAEGLVEAAFLESNKQKSLEYLHKAQNFYKIHGSTNRGQQTLKQFAQKCLEKEDSEESQLFALDIYQALFEEVFEGDNLAWNPDIINSYITLLIQKKQYKRAIEAKKVFIKHMVQAGTVDHQIRRAYLEIVCIHIFYEDWKRIENTLQAFNEDVGGAAYSSDEYQIASSLKEAIDARDFKKLEMLAKKPIFSFLETEIVRTLKKFAMNPPAGLVEETVIASATDDPKAKKKVLDDMML